MSRSEQIAREVASACNALLAMTNSPIRVCAGDDVPFAAAKAIEALPVEGWRDIATAPRDGTPILATVFVHLNGVPSHWDRHVIYADAETGQIHSYADQGWDFDDYTHWMPLPSPPEPGVK